LAPYSFVIFKIHPVKPFLKTEDGQCQPEKESLQV
jgi:hypothetical protein